MHSIKFWLSEGSNHRSVVLDGLSVEIVREENGDFIALEVFLVAVKFLVVFKEVNVEIQTALVVVFVQNNEYLLQHLSVCYFHCEQNENLYLLEDGGDEFIPRHIHDELAKEVEVYFCGDLLVNAFVDVIVLI